MDFLISHPSKHSFWWRRLSSSSSEDVFKTSWSKRTYSHYSCIFRRCLQDVLIKTNIFALVISLQDVFKTSSRHLAKMSSRHLQDVSKASSRYLQDVLPRCVQGAFRTSSRRLAKTSWRHLQDAFKTFWRPLQDVLQRLLQDVFKTYHQVNCLPRSRICLGHTSEKFMVSVESLQMW